MDWAEGRKWRRSNSHTWATCHVFYLQEGRSHQQTKHDADYYNTTGAHCEQQHYQKIGNIIVVLIFYVCEYAGILHAP